MLLHAGLLLAPVTAVALRRGGCTLVVLTLACAAAPGVASAQRHPAGDGARSLKHDLQIDLGRLAAGIGPARARAAGAPGDVLAILERVRATDLLIEDAHREQEATLTRHGASGIVLERHRQAVAQYREALDRLYAAAAALEDPAGFREAAAVGRALEEMARALAGSADDADRRPLGVTLPYRPLALPQVEPRFEAAITPAYLTAPPPAPSGVDLAETPETGLTPALRARAQALGRDPIAIFEFVHNEIRTDFYYGAMKGAAETLRQGSGSDTDQASLLIALLRAAGVPARYVRGVIALPGAQALAWTGVGSTRRAADVFTRAGIPFRPIRQGATIGAFEIEHTWVEAYVPYSNYRGVRLGSIGQAWIPLDPSMKALDVAPGEDVLAASGFDADAVVAEYLAGPRAESPLDFYRARIVAYLEANRPDLTFEQVLAAVAIRPVRSGLLPGTLPYATVSINEEAPSLADALRHTVRFVAGGEGGASFDVAVSAASSLRGPT